MVKNVQAKADWDLLSWNKFMIYVNLYIESRFMYWIDKNKHFTQVGICTLYMQTTQRLLYADYKK